MPEKFSIDIDNARFMTYAMAILGGIAAISVIWVLTLAAAQHAGETWARVGLMVIFPAVVGELLKLIGLVIVGAKQSGWVTSKLDGAVAGALAGLSFGIAIASFSYVAGTARVEQLAPLTMHVLTSAVGGLGIYYATSRKYWVAIALIVGAIGIHLAWNAVAVQVNRIEFLM